VVSEEHAASIFRVEVSRVRMKAGCKEVITQIHGRVTGNRTQSGPIETVNRKCQRKNKNGLLTLFLKRASN
jgi:hypothetical protein